MEYSAPLRDMRFVLNELIGFERISTLRGCEHFTPELADAILDEAAKFASEVLAPLNRLGDAQGARRLNGDVTTADGFRDAYRKFIGAGWNGLACPTDFGGQGLPLVLTAPVEEMWNAANLSFALCPLLTRAAIEALALCASPAQQARLLPKLVSGEWTGTMNLTEPQAGSDLAAVRTRAVPDGDRYLISGQKIFITYGEHDLAENIVHLVLARLPNAPEGVKGISLFVVPKFVINADGSLGARNDVRCLSIEHKLGVHASPTAVLAYGEAGGAVGELVGEANRGLEYMFIMMNLARLAVGLEGVALSDRAYQQALGYARTRIQGSEAGTKGGPRVPIIRHPDVRRMLIGMRAEAEASRALAYVTAAALDSAQRHPQAEERERERGFAELLIPVVKGWCTETAIWVASTGIQVHGGMGFIEETGAAQHLRDARITTIYEGTTGIQANDLIGRKLARDGGAAARDAIARMRETQLALGPADGEDFAAIRAGLAQGVAALDAAVDWVLQTSRDDQKAAHALAVPVLHLFGVVAGGWQMARAALAAHLALASGHNADPGFLRAKIATAHFYADHILPRAEALRQTVLHGATSVLALDEALL
jgi:acyl-CoA dehydrogenase